MCDSEVKVWISRIHAVDKEIETLRRIQREAWDKATNTTPLYGQRQVSATPDAHLKFDRLAELEDEIDRKLAELMQTKTEIVDAINKIPDGKQRIILERRYVCLDSYDDIADFIHYDVRQVYRIHRMALMSLGEIITEKQMEDKMDLRKKRLSAMLGLNNTTAADIVKREDYKTDADFYKALVDTAANMEKPEVRNALRKAMIDSVESDEQEILERQREEFKAIRKGIVLDKADTDSIDAEAKRRARAELASGKIEYSQFGEAIERHAAALTEERKNQRATNKQFNDIIRKKMSNTQDTD